MVFVASQHNPRLLKKKCAKKYVGAPACVTRSEPEAFGDEFLRLLTFHARAPYHNRKSTHGCTDKHCETAASHGSFKLHDPVEALL